MSTRMRTRGMTSTAQKANMSHLLREAARTLRRSNSLGAKGLVSHVAGRLVFAWFISNLVGLLHAFDDEVGGDIDAAGDDEQHDTQDEQRAVMVAAMHGLTHLGGDGGGHGRTGSVRPGG